jgi:hypothetical protein
MRVRDGVGGHFERMGRGKWEMGGQDEEKLTLKGIWEVKDTSATSMFHNSVDLFCLARGSL